MTTTAEMQKHADSLNELAADIHMVAVSKGWYDGGSESLPEKLALVHSEISEALEEYRSGHAPDHVYFDQPVDLEQGEPTRLAKPEGVPIELADAIIRILDLSSWLGIDIGAAVARKIEFNRTRDYRHGGKRV